MVHKILSTPCVTVKQCLLCEKMLAELVGLGNIFEIKILLYLVNPASWVLIVEPWEVQLEVMMGC